MKRKILSSIFGCAMLTAVAFALLTCGVLYNFFENQTRAELERDLRQIGSAIDHDADPISYLRTLDESGLVERLTLISPTGAVLYDSLSDAAWMENHLGREEIRLALKTGFGASARHSDTLGQQTYYCAIRLENGSFLRISDTHSSIMGMLGAYIAYFGAMLVGLCIIFTLVGVRTTDQIVKPINALNLDVPEQNEIYPELEPLLERMSQQSLSIQEYIRTIKASHIEFDAITANMAEGLIVTSAGGEVMFINRSAKRIFGAKKAKGRSILDLSQDAVFQDTLRTALRGKPAGGRLELSRRCYQLHINPIFDAGHFTGLVALIPDVTDQYLAEKNRREFTANVSHELKTPLTSILGYAEIMQSGIADEKDWRGMIECIHKEGARMIRLVENILYLSRLDSGAVYGAPEEIDLAQLLQDILERFRPIADARDIRLQFEGTPVVTRCLRQMTDEMLSNLIDNAIKYNRDGGSVEATLRAEGSEAVICVSDTGIGIDYADQPRVFERFFRADKSRSKATGGTGLGLSIVKHAITRMNGAIELDSRPGEGTRITLRFPICRE